MPTDIPRCETCRHWSTSVARDLGDCGLAESNELGDPLHEATRAWAVGQSPSGEAQWGDLRTRSDFGCIAHEPKEGQAA